MKCYNAPQEDRWKMSIIELLEWTKTKNQTINIIYDQNYNNYNQIYNEKNQPNQTGIR